MCGLRNEAAQKELLTESDLTLEKAINISVTTEMSSKEAQKLNATGRVHKFSSGTASGGKLSCYNGLCITKGNPAQLASSKEAVTRCH